MARQHYRSKKPTRGKYLPRKMGMGSGKDRPLIKKRRT